MKEKVNTGYESGSGRFSIVLNDTLSHGGCTEDTRAKWLLSNLDGKCCKADCDGLLTNPRFLRQDHSLLEPVCWSTKSVKYRFFDLLITFLISRRFSILLHQRLTSHPLGTCEQFITFFNSILQLRRKPGDRTFWNSLGYKWRMWI